MSEADDLIALAMAYQRRMEELNRTTQVPLVHRTTIVVGGAVVNETILPMPNDVTMWQYCDIDTCVFMHQSLEEMEQYRESLDDAWTRHARMHLQQDALTELAHHRAQPIPDDYDEGSSSSGSGSDEECDFTETSLTSSTSTSRQMDEQLSLPMDEESLDDTTSGDSDCLVSDELEQQDDAIAGYCARSSRLDPMDSEVGQGP